MKERRCQVRSKAAVAALACVVFSSINSTDICYARKSADDIPDRLFVGSKPPERVVPVTTPTAAVTDNSSNTGSVDEQPIVPPSENSYYPVRTDDQPFRLNIDTTVNLTDAMNRTYFDPKWRGEVWTPFDQVTQIERATRLMAGWPQYDEQNVYRTLTGVSKWFEKYSGFGP